MKKLFYFLLAMPFVFAACEPTEEPAPQPEPEKNPQLILTSDAEMSFKAEGGNGIITYTLVNPVEGTELEATCEADWVTNLTVGDNIVFVVAANEGDAREAKIAVAYGELGFEVAVKQAAKGETPDNTPKFNLTSEAEMEFGQDEAMGTITYEIVNPINGVNVTAKANVDWISQVTVQTDKIVFAVAANTGAAREGKITAEYGMLKFEVKVKQAEYVAPAPVLTLEATTLTVEAEGGVQTIAYTLENPVEGVELVAEADVEWISEVAAQDGSLTFNVAANEDGMRNGKVTLTYGELTAELTVSQLMPNANPDLNYGVYPLDYLKAHARTSNVWDITISETDKYLGSDIMTRITVQLAEDNAMLIPDGTYSVANGGILVNTSTDNLNSTYRRNTSTPVDITDATLTIVNDLANATSVITCSFQVGNDVLSFEYSGNVNGFVYEEIGDEGITEWDSFKIQSQWDDCKYVVGKSSSVTVEFYIHKQGGTKSDPLAAGVYPIGAWESVTSRDYCESDSSKVNGTRLVSGEVVVEDDAAGYKLTFNVVDTNGTTWKGTYVGAIN